MDMKIYGAEKYDSKGFNNTYYYDYDQKNFRLKHTPFYKNKDLLVTPINVDKINP